MFNLTSGKFEYEPEGIPIITKRMESNATLRKNTLYEKLIAAGQRLAAVIVKCCGMSNKDVIKFTDQINNLCDKWQ